MESGGQTRARDRVHWRWYSGPFTENERKAYRLERRFRRRGAFAYHWMMLVLPFSKLLGQKRTDMLIAWKEAQAEVRFTFKERAEWVELVLNQLDDGPERVQKCREILLGYHSNREKDLRKVLFDLTVEFKRHEMALEQGITEFNELDRYLCGLDEEGYILDRVPWAVLRADLRQILPSDYRWMKRKVLEASPKSREELDVLIPKLFKETDQRKSDLYGEIGPPREEKRMMMEELDAIVDRLFELKYPEFVTRIPGKPPILDREGQRESEWDRLGIKS